MSILEGDGEQCGKAYLVHFVDIPLDFLEGFPALPWPVFSVWDSSVIMGFLLS